MFGNSVRRKISIIIELSAKKFNKGIETIKAKLKNLGKWAVSHWKMIATVVGGAFAAMAVSTAKVAARTQVLNRVLGVVGQTAGFATSELKETVKGIMALGIAEQEAIQLSIRFMQSQLDLADSFKIARAAQDLAVIAGKDSSQTAITLTNAIVMQRPILLKQFGIVENLITIYGNLAKQLGKTRTELTAGEKKQAFINVILEKAARVAGVYEAAMRDVGKRMTSLPRHFQAASNAIGRHFLPALGFAVDGLTSFLKFITKTFGTEEKVTPIDKLGTKFEALAIKIDIATEKLKSNKIGLEEYIKTIRDIDKNLDKVIDESVKEVVESITGTTRSELQAQRLLFDAFTAGKIPQSAFADASKELSVFYEKMAAANNREFAGWVKDFSEVRKLLLIEKGGDTLKDIRDALTTILDDPARGFGAKPIENMKSYLRSLGYDPDLIAEFFVEATTKALEDAGKIIANRIGGKRVLSTLPISFDDDDVLAAMPDVFTPHGAKEQFDTFLEIKESFIDESIDLNREFFELSLNGLDEFQQAEKLIQFDHLTELDDIDALFFADKISSKAANQLAELAMDKKANAAQLLELKKQISAEAKIKIAAGMFVNRMEFALVNQRLSVEKAAGIASIDTIKNVVNARIQTRAEEWALLAVNAAIKFDFVTAAKYTALVVAAGGAMATISSIAGRGISGLENTPDEFNETADETFQDSGGAPRASSTTATRGIQNMFISPSITFQNTGTQIIGDTGLVSAAETIGDIAVARVKEALDTGELAVT